MSRRKRISKESDAICAHVYDEVSKVRQERDLRNIIFIFAFPRVRCQGAWQSSGPLIAAAIAKRNKSLGHMKMRGRSRSHWRVLKTWKYS